ncbi:hypothetical protein SBADM41S_06722 [Streptomyces badius]
MKQLETALTFAQELLERGVRMRTLYQHTAQFHQGTAAYVEHVAPLGGEVRTTASGFPRMLVFDRRVAVLALKGHPEGALVLRNENVIDVLVDTFERTWVGARPSPELQQGPDRTRLLRGQGHHHAPPCGGGERQEDRGAGGAS